MPRKSTKAKETEQVVAQEQVLVETTGSGCIQIPETSELVNSNVHRIFVIDCSYSMCRDLPRIGDSLKNKIPQITNPEDFVTLIWFSGDNQFGTIQEHISIKSLTDLSTLNSTIDKFLHPVGSTGFVEPLNLAVDTANKHPETPQIIFMTDGGDNCWPRDKILDACSKITCENVVIEYGWYADKELITKMCEKSNGTVVFNEDFDKFDGSIKTYLNNTIAGKKIELSSSVDTFALVDNTVKIFKSQNGKCLVPENLKCVYTADSQDTSIMYLGLVYALRTKNNELLSKIAKQLGDVNFTKKISTCFTKQDINLLEEELIQASLHPEHRLKLGYNQDYEVSDSVFNLFEFFDMLTRDQNAKYYPYMLDEKYQRISKKTNTDDGFKPTTTLGCKINFVYHSSRANISIGCKIHGYIVNGSEEPIPSSIFRNYSVVKDGIKNIKKLPVSFSQDIYQKLVDEMIIPKEESYESGKVFKVNIEDIPLINKKMVSSTELNLERYALTNIIKLVLSAERKYINSRIKMLRTTPAEAGTEAPAHPESDEPAEQKDFYMSRELTVKIAKCSSLPTVNDKLLEKLTANNKLTLSESLMSHVHSRTEGFTEEQYLTELKSVETRLASIQSYLTSSKFAVLVCGKWFSETEDSVTTNVDYNHNDTMLNFSCTISIENKKVWL